MVLHFVVGVVHWATQEKNPSGKSAPGPYNEMAAIGRSVKNMSPYEALKGSDGDGVRGNVQRSRRN